MAPALLLFFFLKTKNHSMMDEKIQIVLQHKKNEPDIEGTRSFVRITFFRNSFFSFECRSFEKRCFCTFFRISVLSKKLNFERTLIEQTNWTIQGAHDKSGHILKAYWRKVWWQNPPNFFAYYASIMPRSKKVFVFFLNFFFWIFFFEFFFWI